MTRLTTIFLALFAFALILPPTSSAQSSSHEALVRKDMRGANKNLSKEPWKQAGEAHGIVRVTQDESGLHIDVSSAKGLELSSLWVDGEEVAELERDPVGHRFTAHLGLSKAKKKPELTLGFGEQNVRCQVRQPTHKGGEVAMLLLPKGDEQLHCSASFWASYL